MTETVHDPSQDELEALFVNNADLDKITAFLNRFNPIRVMRMEGMEIRHSAILAWLLDPIENHGFGDTFLRAFLAQALRGAEGTFPTALDVSQADLRDAEIQREKRNMDIFVSSPSNGWAFIIENKFHSKQNDGQLAKYLKRAEEDAAEAKLDFVHQGVFLTLYEEEPKDPSYVTLRYSDICTILSSMLEANSAKLGQEIRQFLNHYLEIIRDATDMSEDQREMEALAKQLYRSHKKALDFIMEHGVSTEFAIAAETLFGDELDYGSPATVEGVDVMYNWSGQHTFSFLPLKWVAALGGEDSKPWRGCERWWAEFPVICWFQLNTKDDGIGGTLFLYAEVGPLADTEVRSFLIEQIQGCARGKTEKLIKFRAGAKKAGARYSKFLNGNSVTIKDISDAEAIADGMRRLMKSYSPVFKAVEEGLKGFSLSKRGGDD